MKKRIGNDFLFYWIIKENNIVINPNDVLDFKIIIRHRRTGSEIVAEFDVVNSSPSIKCENLLYLGIYDLIATWKTVDYSFEDGFRNSSADVQAFEIVSSSSSECETDLTVTSEIAIGFEGADAFEVWLKNGNEGKTYEDYIAFLQKPATDAAALVGVAIENANEAAAAANESALLVQDSADNADAKAILANNAAILATEKAALADSKATLANDKAILAQSAADNANAKAAEVTAAVLSAGSLGSIKPTDAAPTPARNGNYTFSIGGNKPAWLTAEAGVIAVKAGDGVAVVFAAPSSYSYTHIKIDRIADIYNVTVEIPLSAGQYYTDVTAILAIPIANRKMGLKVTYSPASQVWVTLQHIGASMSGFTDLVNWKNEIGVQTGFIAVAPLFTVDASYNATSPSGNIDIYYQNNLKRLTEAQSFTITSGSGTIVLDLIDNILKVITYAANTIPGRYVIVGTFNSFNVRFNGNVIVKTPNDTNYGLVKRSDMPIDVGFFDKCPDVTVSDTYVCTIPVDGNIDIHYGIGFKRITNVAQSFTITSSSGLIALDLRDSTIKTVLNYNLVPGVHVILGTYNGFNVAMNGNVKVITPYEIIINGVRASAITDNKYPLWVENQAMSACIRINDFKAGDDALIFPILSDLHVTLFPDNLKQLTYVLHADNYIGYDFVVDGGDIGLDSASLSNTEIKAKQILSKYASKQGEYKGLKLQLFGNHDRNSVGPEITPAIFSNYLTQPSNRRLSSVIYGDAAKTYGYYDNNRMKIRTFFLNSSDVVSFGNNYGFTTTQLQWFANNMQVSDGWDILVLTHFCVNSCARWVSYPTITCLNSDIYIAIMEAFVAKTAGGTTVTYDFSSINSSCRLIANLTGDAHIDSQAISNGVNYITTQSYGVLPPTEVPIGAYFTDRNQTNQMLADIFVIKKTGEFKIVRMGAGEVTRDRTFTY